VPIVVVVTIAAFEVLDVVGAVAEEVVALEADAAAAKDAAKWQNWLTADEGQLFVAVEWFEEQFAAQGELTFAVRMVEQAGKTSKSQN
jgi:hypothetical protein